MAQTVKQIIEVIAPEIYASPNLDSYILLAECKTSETYFGECYNYAVALRASHIGTMAGRGGNEVGKLSGKKVGPVSISFNTGGSRSYANSSLSTTSYGIELQDMIRNKPGGRATVTGTTTAKLRTGII